LKWSIHVHNISAKANRTLSLLRRNLKIANQSLREIAYLTFVRPQLEYAVAVWSPSLNKDITQLEKINRRAARFVCNNYHHTASVTAMMEQLGWEKLKDRRHNLRLCLMYKIIHNHVCIPLSEFITESDAATSSITTRSSYAKNLPVPYARTDTYKFSFGPCTCANWNKLPDHVKDIKLFNLFKMTIK